jgi:hypothetical protein
MELLLYQESNHKKQGQLASQDIHQRSKILIKGSSFDSNTCKVSAKSDFLEYQVLAQDDEFNYTDTPTASWVGMAQVMSESPMVNMTVETPAIYREDDSIFTLHPNRQNTGGAAQGPASSTDGTSNVAAQTQKDEMKSPLQKLTIMSQKAWR